MTTLLSVNVNKIAVLRNSRGGSEPSVITAAECAIAAGCGGITVHPRPDQRHIRPQDVLALAAIVRGRVESNLEGNPFSPPHVPIRPRLCRMAMVRSRRITASTCAEMARGWSR
jgi:pyridoxine 5-phosphate synthase